jgi:hypothetical protein
LRSSSGKISALGRRVFAFGLAVLGAASATQAGAADRAAAADEGRSVTVARPPFEPRVTLESAWLVAAGEGPGMRLAAALPDAAGPPDAAREAAEQLVTGRFRHEGELPAEGLRIVIPVPPGRQYVAGSATGPRAEVRYSLDGVTFAAAADLRVPADSKDPAGEQRTALPEEYTHIRWELPGVFPPGTTGLVSFRVRIPQPAPEPAMIAGADDAGEAP